MTIATLDTMSSAHLRGERMTTEHVADVQWMHRDEAFMAYLGGVRSDAATQEYVERNVAHWDEHGFGIWILRDPKTSKVIGRGGLRHVEIEGVDEVGVGYAFFPERWGRGLATEVALACLATARDALGLGSVVADAHPDNAASIRVMVKVGFGFEREVTIQGVPLVLYRKLLSP
jgi:RimJ/RimL family protein N-acetyltransferase